MSYRTKSPTAVSGFTLVELLVVIGIIALLISMLLPALNKAREASVSVQCLARLRELGNACHLFAAENKGSYPPIFGGSMNTYTFPSWYSSPCIFPALTATSHVSQDIRNGTMALERGYLSKYINKSYNYNRYVCPTLEGQVVPSRLGNHSYGYNRYIGGAPSNWGELYPLGNPPTTWKNSQPYKLGGFKQSSAVALFVDRFSLSEGIGGGGNALWFRNEPAAETNGAWGNYNSPNAYHLPTSPLMHKARRAGGTYTSGALTLPAMQGLVNIAFADGSARSVPFKVDRFPAKPMEGVLVRPNIPQPKW